MPVSGYKQNAKPQPERDRLPEEQKSDQGGSQYRQKNPVIPIHFPVHFYIS